MCVRVRVRVATRVHACLNVTVSVATLVHALICVPNPTPQMPRTVSVRVMLKQQRLDRVHPSLSHRGEPHYQTVCYIITIAISIIVPFSIQASP